MDDTLPRYLILLSVMATCVRCAPKENNNDVVGLWGAYSNSVYLEMIIWPEPVHSIEGKTGNNLWVSDWLFYYSPDDLLEGSLQNCVARKDSLFFSDGGLQIDTATIRDGQIILAIDTIELRFSRVSADVAMLQLSKIDTLSWDNTFFRSYLEGYSHRRDSIRHNDVRP